MTTNSRKQPEEAATVSEFVKKNSTRNYESSRREVFERASVVMRLSVRLLDKRPQILDEDGNFLGRDNIRWTEAEKEVIGDWLRLPWIQ